MDNWPKTSLKRTTLRRTDKKPARHLSRNSKHLESCRSSCSSANLIRNSRATKIDRQVTWMDQMTNSTIKTSLAVSKQTSSPTNRSPCAGSDPTQPPLAASVHTKALGTTAVGQELKWESLTPHHKINRRSLRTYKNFTNTSKTRLGNTCSSNLSL